MLEEVICCLSGNQSSLTSSGLLLSGLKFPHQQSLAPFIAVSVPVKTLQTFIGQNDDGIYLAALRRGIQEVVLNPYDETLQDAYKEFRLQREKRIDNQQTPFMVPLTRLRVLLSEHELIIPAFVSLIEDIYTKGARGAHILDRMLCHSQSGIPFVQTAMKTVIRDYVDPVLVQQIAAWLSYGIIADPFREFFIQHNPSAVSQWNSSYTFRSCMLPTTYISSETCSSILFVGKAQHVSRTEPMKTQSMNVERHKQLNLCQAFDRDEFYMKIEALRKQAAQELWERVVEEEHLENHLMDLKSFFFLANGAFYEEFIVNYGENLLRLTPMNSKTDLDVARSAFLIAASKFQMDESLSFQRFRLCVRPISCDVNFRSLSKNIILCGSAKHLPSKAGILLAEFSELERSTSAPSAIWQNDRWTIDEGFIAAFTISLRGSASVSLVFQNNSLDACGDNMYPSVSFTFGCASADPSAVSISIRALNSEVYKLRIDTVKINDGFEHPVSVTWVPFARDDVSPSVVIRINDDAVFELPGESVLKAFRILGNRAFVGLTGECLGTSETDLIARSFSLQQSGDPTVSSLCLSLQYETPKGVNLMIGVQEIDRYSDLFTFLLRVKTVHWHLRRAWTMTSKSTSTHHRTTLLRSRMQFLLDNLQIYLNVDVIEAQYSKMLQSIQASKDFDSIRTAHDHYLANLGQQCFLRGRVVMRALEHVFDVCMDFCKYLELSLASKPQTTQLHVIESMFHRESCFLFSVISTKSGHYSAPHLAQLILRINYNGYFAAMTKEAGLS